MGNLPVHEKRQAEHAVQRKLRIKICLPLPLLQALQVLQVLQVWQALYG